MTLKTKLQTLRRMGDQQFSDQIYLISINTFLSWKLLLRENDIFRLKFECFPLSSSLSSTSKAIRF